MASEHGKDLERMARIYGYEASRTVISRARCWPTARISPWSERTVDREGSCVLGGRNLQLADGRNAAPVDEDPPHIFVN